MTFTEIPIQRLTNFCMNLSADDSSDTVLRHAPVRVGVDGRTDITGRKLVEVKTVIMKHLDNIRIKLDLKI
ncbi:hypothetical protein DPMN_193881 [Dreissena polymorpha]|uniref:Uncharacterized protein n=1 Tax=Dreissena polymorpha TaxID=45954 RepID=A0A9D3Y457_DREPO|nr:hypothetical protein DPMN_193881 [Dreissena polymorpha]